MTLHIQWNDIIDIPEDTSSVRIQRHDSDWKQILEQATCLPQLTHLEFGGEITSVEFIEAVLESNIMPNVEHILLPEMAVGDYLSHLHALQSLYMRSLCGFSPPFNHFSMLTSLDIEYVDMDVFYRISSQLSQLTVLCVRTADDIPINDLWMEPIRKMTQLRELMWPTPMDTSCFPHLETVCFSFKFDKSTTPWLGNTTLRTLTLQHALEAKNVLPALTNMSQLTRLTLGGRLNGLEHLLKPISAMTSLESLNLEKRLSLSQPQNMADWIQHLPASLQSLRLYSVFCGDEIDWKGFYKFNQLTSLDCSYVGHLWSNFNGLWSQLPTTLTSLTLKAQEMNAGWLSVLPSLPHLTCLSVLENTALTSGVSHILKGYTSLYDKFPELMWFKRDVRRGVREELILLEQHRKRLPLTFWATHPLHPDKLAFKTKEKALRISML